MLCNTTASILPRHVRALLSFVCLRRKGNLKDQLYCIVFIYYRLLGHKAQIDCMKSKQQACQNVKLSINPFISTNAFSVNDPERKWKKSLPNPESSISKRAKYGMTSQLRSNLSTTACNYSQQHLLVSFCMQITLFSSIKIGSDCHFLL